MEDPHHLLATNTFSCSCSLIICSTIHSGIHRGSEPGSLDYIYFYPFLESQELGKLYGGQGASRQSWWTDLIWVDGREEEAIGKSESLQSKCGWKPELFTDTENSFVLVKSWLGEIGQPWKKNAALEAEKWPMPQEGIGGEWQRKTGHSPSYTTFFFSGCPGVCFPEISQIPQSLNVKPQVCKNRSIITTLVSLFLHWCGCGTQLQCGTVGGSEWEGHSGTETPFCHESGMAKKGTV